MTASRLTDRVTSDDPQIDALVSVEELLRLIIEKNLPPGKRLSADTAVS